MLVWAYKRLTELDGKVGFVVCDDKTGKNLLNTKRVQSPSIGANALKHIDYSPIKKKKNATRKKD